MSNPRPTTLHHQQHFHDCISTLISVYVSIREFHSPPLLRSTPSLSSDARAHTTTNRSLRYSKQPCHPNTSMGSMMDAALSSPLMDTFPISRLSSPDDSPALSPTRTEIDLPADVDESFNSSMSFSTCDSPPAPSPSMHLGKPKYDALYSPTPLALPANKRALMATKSLSSAVDNATLGAPFNRSLGPSPAFGRELSVNVPRPNMFNQSSFKGRGRMLPPSVPEGKLVSPNRLHSTSSQENMRSPQVLMPRWGRREVRHTSSVRC